MEITRRITHNILVVNSLSSFLSIFPNPTINSHSFSTTVTLSQGVPLETVSKMLGHTSIKTTQIYAKITRDKIGRDMDALEAKIGDKYQLPGLILNVKGRKVRLF